MGIHAFPQIDELRLSLAEGKITEDQFAKNEEGVKAHYASMKAAEEGGGDYYWRMQLKQYQLKEDEEGEEEEEGGEEEEDVAVFRRETDTVGERRESHNYSPVRYDRPDYARFPLQRTDTTPIVCIVRSGEILYNPSHWWHEVQSSPDREGKTIGVNWFFEPLHNRHNASDPFLHFNRHYTHLAPVLDRARGYPVRFRRLDQLMQGAQPGQPGGGNG